jgi:hypothetical protein
MCCVHSLSLSAVSCSVPGLSITAVGARRQLVLGVPGIEEDVGMLGIHLPDGTFLELVPWAGQVEWSADPWGQWRIWARARGYEALLEASCADNAGAIGMFGGGGAWDMKSVTQWARRRFGPAPGGGGYEALPEASCDQILQVGRVWCRGGWWVGVLGPDLGQSLWQCCW